MQMIPRNDAPGQPLFSHSTCVSVSSDDWCISPVSNFNAIKDNCIYKVRSFFYQKLKSCRTFFIKTVDLAKHIGSSIRNTRRNLTELANRGFITLEQQSHGWIVTLNEEALISKVSQRTGPYNTETSNLNIKRYGKNKIRSHHCRRINATVAAEHLAKTRTSEHDTQDLIRGIFKGIYKFDKGIKQVVDVKYEKAANPFKQAADYLERLFSNTKIRVRRESIEFQLERHAHHSKVFRRDFQEAFPEGYWHQVDMFFGKAKQAIYSNEGIEFIDAYMTDTYQRIKERLQMSYHKDYTAKPAPSFQEKYARQEPAQETPRKRPSELSQEEIYRREYEGWRYNKVNVKAMEWQLKALGITDINDSILDRAAHLMASGKLLKKEAFFRSPESTAST